MHKPKKPFPPGFGHGCYQATESEPGQTVSYNKPTLKLLLSESFITATGNESKTSGETGREAVSE